TEVISIDNFGTRNGFNGVDMGFRSQFSSGPVSLEVLTKVAVGGLSTTVGISGAQRTLVPGSDPVSSPGGVLALASNIGTYKDSRVKFLPEAGLNLKWQALSNLELRVGYSFMLLNGVARAGNQVDTIITPANFGATTPAADSRP